MPSLWLGMMAGGDSLLKGNKYVFSDSNTASYIVEGTSCPFDISHALHEQYQEKAFSDVIWTDSKTTNMSV